MMQFGRVLCVLAMSATAMCGSHWRGEAGNDDEEGGLPANEWQALIAEELLMQKVGLYWARKSSKQGRSIESMCEAIEVLELQGYGDIAGGKSAHYRFWRLYSRVVFYDAFMRGHAKDWPELTQAVMEESSPGWRRTVEAGAKGVGGIIDYYEIWPDDMPRKPGEVGVSSNLCRATARLVLQHLVDEYSVSSLDGHTYVYALDFDGDGKADVAVGMEEMDQFACALGT